MGKRKLNEGQSSEPSTRKKATRQAKGKEKAAETTPKRPTPTNSSSSTEEAPIRGLRFKSVGNKKTTTQEVNLIGNPSKQFRNKEHESRFKELKNKNITCGRDIDWESFKEMDFFGSLNVTFEVMKWEKLANFDEMKYSETLVKEIYASLPLFSDKNRKTQDDDVHCFVNGIEVTITAKDLGVFLATEYEHGPVKRPSEFDADQVWKKFTDSTQTFAQSSASSWFKTAELKILHAFVDGTIFGHQGSHNTVSRDELWVMYRAVHQARVNTAQFMLDNIKSVAGNSKFVMPYANILTSYFKSKGLWNDRYEGSMKESNRQPVRPTKLLNNVFTLQGNQWVKKAQTTRQKSHVQIDEEIESENDEPAAPQASESTPTIIEFLTRIEQAIMNLREEVNEKLDLQNEKIDALDAEMKKVEQQVVELQTHGKTAEGQSEEQNAVTTSSSTPKQNPVDVDDTNDNTKTVQDEETSRMEPEKQTLEHLSEAASTFENQNNPSPSPAQTSPKPPADDMLFMFPTK